MPSGLLPPVAFGISARLAFDFDSRRACFGLLGGGAAGFARRSGAQVQLPLTLLQHGSRENAVLLATPPFGPSADRSAYYALC